MRIFPSDVNRRRRCCAGGGTSIDGGGFRKPFHGDVDGRNGRLVKQSPVLESEPARDSFFYYCESPAIIIFELSILHEKEPT